MTETERLRLAAFAASGEKSYLPLLEKHNGRYNQGPHPPSPVAQAVQSSNATTAGALGTDQTAGEQSAMRTEAIAGAVALGIRKHVAARLAAAAPSMLQTSGDILSFILRNR